MDELSVTVNIANRPYRLKIKKEEEEVIRASAKRIEELMKSYANQFHYSDQQDLLAMAALQLASSTGSLEKQIDYRDSEMTDKLKEIDAFLNEKLKI